MELNPYSIPPIISLTAIFTVGLLAYRHDSSSPINKSFLYLCLSVSFWLFNFSVMYNCKNEHWALFWAKIGFIGVILIPVTGYLFTYRLLNLTPIPHLRKILIFTFLSIPLISSKLIYAGIKKEFWGFYPIAGKIYFIYIIFFTILYLLNIRILFIHLQKNAPSNPKYQQIKYVLFSFIIVLTGVVDFIAKYPVEIYPFAWLSALVFIFLITYGILKYQIGENERLRQNEKKLADLYTQADKLSKTDTLTEINNRRHFSEMLNKRMQDCEATKTSFYLVIFDVDHFKEINDSYGHIFGDKVLVKVIEIVKNNIRSKIL